MLLVALVCVLANLRALREVHPDTLSVHIVSEDEVNILAVPKVFAHKLWFYIHSPTTRKRSADCGGCKALWALRDVLVSSGYSASAYRICPPPHILKRVRAENRTLVIIKPEVDRGNCTIPTPQPVLYVRWILAPLGIHVPRSTADTWGREDLVFNYATSTGDNVPINNVLQVVANPEKGDATDISDEVFYNHKRSGIAWMMRKGKLFHRPSWLKDIHEHPGFNTTEVGNGLTPTVFQRYEYFVTYDPYTYWSWFAAMSGAVSVVHPVENVTKSEWALGTFLGSYLQDIKNHNGGETRIPGIAYGWEPDQLDYARRTMGELRGFLFKVKEWGTLVTVPRFARDCYRYCHGQRRNLEGAMTVSEVYP